jgi:hypothetical protein
MEPLAILSLVGTIVQLVDFSGRIISESRQIYREGVTIDNVELDSITRDLAELAGDIKWTYLGPRKLTQLSPNDKAIVRLGQSVVVLSRELINAIDKTKSTTGPRVWSSLIQAMKTVLSKEEINSITTRLERFRSELELRTLVDMRQRIKEHEVRADVQYDTIRNDLKEIMEVVLQKDKDVLMY